MTFYTRDGRTMTEAHDMTTEGQGSNSRLNTARMQQDSPENADRLLAERRAATAAAESHDDKMQEHYAEMAAKRTAERLDASIELGRENYQRERLEARIAQLQFELDDPEPSMNDPHTDGYASIEAHAAWEERRKARLERSEGEELADRIFSRIHTPWL